MKKSLPPLGLLALAALLLLLAIAFAAQPTVLAI